MDSNLEILPIPHWKILPVRHPETPLLPQPPHPTRKQPVPLLDILLVPRPDILPVLSRKHCLSLAGNTACFLAGCTVLLPETLPVPAGNMACTQPAGDKASHRRNKACPQLEVLHAHFNENHFQDFRCVKWQLLDGLVRPPL